MISVKKDKKVKSVLVELTGWQARIAWWVILSIGAGILALVLIGILAVIRSL